MRRQEIEVKGLNEPISHYVDAVRFGDLLFISGLGPFDAALQLVGGTMRHCSAARSSRTWRSA